MLEDPAPDERVGEGGDAVAAAAARGAAQHVHREGPLEEFGPALALWFGAGLSFGLGLADAWRGTEPSITPTTRCSAKWQFGSLIHFKEERP